jgi:hypothetical protein
MQRKVFAAMAAIFIMISIGSAAAQTDYVDGFKILLVWLKVWSGPINATYMTADQAAFNNTYVKNLTVEQSTVINQTVINSTVSTGNITAPWFNGNWNGSALYVPYIGATYDVNLGIYNISAANVTVHESGSVSQVSIRGARIDLGSNTSPTGYGTIVAANNRFQIGGYSRNMLFYGTQSGGKNYTMFEYTTGDSHWYGNSMFNISEVNATTLNISSGVLCNSTACFTLSMLNESTPAPDLTPYALNTTLATMAWNQTNETYAVKNVTGWLNNFGYNGSAVMAAKGTFSTFYVKNGATTAFSIDISGNPIFTTPFAPRNAFGGNRIYLSDIHDALYQGFTRFVVTQSNFVNFGNTGPATNASIANLFNGGYETYAVRTNAGETSVLNIELTGRGEFDANGIQYSAGYIMMGFYSDYGMPSSVSVRTKDHDGVWTAATNVRNVSTIGTRAYYMATVATSQFLTEIEITVNAYPGSNAHISGIDYWLTRPDVTPQVSINKNIDQDLYKTWSWNNGTNNVTVTIDPAGKVSSWMMNATSISANYINVSALSPMTGNVNTTGWGNFSKGICNATDCNPNIWMGGGGGLSANSTGWINQFGFNGSFVQSHDSITTPQWVNAGIGVNTSLLIASTIKTSGGSLAGNQLVDVYGNLTVLNSFLNDAGQIFETPMRIGANFQTSPTSSKSAVALFVDPQTDADSGNYFFVDGILIDTIVKNGIGNITSIAGIYMEGQSAANYNYAIATNRGYVYHGDKVRINPTASYFNPATIPTEALTVVGNGSFTTTLKVPIINATSISTNHINTTNTNITTLTVGGNSTLNGVNMTLSMPNLRKLDGTIACTNGDALKWEAGTGRIYCG